MATDMIDVLIIHPPGWKEKMQDYFVLLSNNGSGGWGWGDSGEVGVGSLTLTLGFVTR